MTNKEHIALLKLQKLFLKKAVDCERIALKNKPDKYGAQKYGDEQYKRTLHAEAGRWAWLEAEGMLKSLVERLDAQSGK